MKQNIHCLSWNEEKISTNKKLKLVEKAESKLIQIGYTLVTRSTYWMVYDLVGGRQIFETPEELYKYSYRKKYKHDQLKFSHI